MMNFRPRKCTTSGNATAHAEAQEAEGGKTLRRAIVCTLSMLTLFPALMHGQSPEGAAIEIVESIPEETVLDNPDIRNAHEVWLQMIGEARSTLDIEEFYISNQPGEPLEDVVDAVAAAGRRGVRVRIIVDSRMHKTYPETVDFLGRQENISSRVIDFGALAGGIQHSKYFIVDGGEVFLGSQNFDWRALKHIHEIGVRLRSKELAAVYGSVFEADWNFAGGDDSTARSLLRAQAAAPVVRLAGESGDTLEVKPTASPAGFIPDSAMWDEPNILALIEGAGKELSLQFLSYATTGRDNTPYDVLDGALRRAAGRGVAVRLIVSDWERGTPSEKALKDLALVPGVSVKFSSIPEWSGGYVSFARVEHCKYVVADSTACWIGTSNAEKSYFTATRNVGIFVRGTSIPLTLRRIFMKSWDGPYTELVRQDVRYQQRRHGEN